MGGELGVFREMEEGGGFGGCGFVLGEIRAGLRDDGNGCVLEGVFGQGGEKGVVFERGDVGVWVCL